MASIDVIILTYNEEIHLARALASVRKFAKSVFIIDSGSTDSTVEIAQDYGATVLVNPFVNQAKQMHWALENAPLSSDWIMRLDADEVIEAELSSEILVKLDALGKQVTGINLKRKHIFMGRWIRYGGRYPVIMLRIWRRGMAHCEDRWMDEHMVVNHGNVVMFEHPFSDINLQNLTFFTQKHNSYATREAVEILIQRCELIDGKSDFNHTNVSRQTFLKRTIKNKVYNKLPFWFGPFAYFLSRYILQFGFLDGKPGLIYHFLQGFWYRFLVGAKVEELDGELRAIPRRQDRLKKLEELTGYRIEC